MTSPARMDFYNQMLRNADPTVQDLVMVIRVFSAGDKAFTKFSGETSLANSPYSPFARTLLVNEDWEESRIAWRDTKLPAVSGLVVRARLAVP